MIFHTMLATGCGDDIAISLARIARESGAVPRLIGCDMRADHPGPAFFDQCVQVPPARDPGYLDALESVIRAHDVDLVVPTSEAEIGCLHAAGALERFAGVTVVAANGRAVETGLDKYSTYETLSARGLGVPWTRIVGEQAPASLPCILKPRRGQGSKGLRLIETESDVTNFGETRAGDLWQELLLPEDEEYTCGLYRGQGRETRMLVFRRRLQGGITVEAEVVDVAPFEVLLDGIADALELEGSVNVQLRRSSGEPKVFEINPRFSSTVAFRHKLGFRDFIWSLLERRGLNIESYCPPAVGTRLYRGGTEIVIA